MALLRLLALISLLFAVATPVRDIAHDACSSEVKGTSPILMHSLVTCFFFADNSSVCLQSCNGFFLHVTDQARKRYIALAVLDLDRAVSFHLSKRNYIHA